MVILGSGSWLKGDDITAGDKIKFVDGGKWVENAKYKYPDGNPKQDFICRVLHNDKEKDFRINKTNRDALVKSLGNDTEKWIGKDVQVTSETALVSGKRTKVILIVAEETAWDA